MNTQLNSLIKSGQVSKRYYRPESELELASLTRFEKVYTKIVETPQEGAADVAQDIAKAIERTVREKGRCVIGLGAGKCALDIYDELVKLYFADRVSFADVVVFNLAELGIGTMNEGNQNTIKRLKERLLDKIDIDPSNIHSFSADATKENVHKLCKVYETEIDEFGGLDLVVCELTKSAGLAFNESGATTTSTCRLVLLSSDTQQRIAESYQCAVAPATAVTLGVANILAARKIICAAWGEDSAEAIYNTIEGKLTELNPSSFLQLHHNVKLVVDLEAASKLTRINFPWKVTSCEWTDYLVRRAIVWLSQLTGKPILKLTNKDYTENGLSDLVAIYGSAYNANIEIFNEMQHTITGWPGGKPNADDSNRPERAIPYPKRVLAFGPQPDDVVVAMGGTLRRLVQQGHDVHVAFQTAGDIASADEDLVRNVMLTEKISSHYGQPVGLAQNLRNSISEHLKNKAPGDPDTPDMRFLKGMIFVCEGIMSCSYMGVKKENIHELQLPFYVDDPFGNGRVTEADVAPIVRLLQEVRPHQIFFTEGTNTPYASNSNAANALLLAIDQLKNEPFMAECRMWMYKGQWAEWGLDLIEMAVPMSPEEFTYKRDAILKHQSQIHDAPFREPDDSKLSWQRSIDRNHDTADKYAALGLATYEAMEVFVQYHPTR
ncbi:MAG: 6-phosphogluconolactonase [Muribaculaceae bacterium]|nr:6-phosphogluconolactonase [Muribaculaceae bacterium]